MKEKKEKTKKKMTREKKIEPNKLTHTHTHTHTFAQRISAKWFINKIAGQRFNFIGLNAC